MLIDGTITLNWSEEGLVVGGIAHYLFDADFCNVASGWEKGVVENDAV